MKKRVPGKDLQHSAKKPRNRFQLETVCREKNPPADITTYTYKSSVFKKKKKKV